MRRCMVTFLFAVAIAVTNSISFAEEGKTSEEVKGHVLILKATTPEKAGTINWGGLIVVEISDSGSRPPQDIQVDGGKCTALGHVRGVATNREGKSMMGGGYTWYLFKAPADARSVEIEASYTPNGQSTPKPIKRHYQVQLDKQG
jgi:hypothetical protein